MNAADPLESLPTLPLEDLCERVLMDAEQRAAQDPTLPRLHTQREIARELLRRVNLEFFAAINRNDVAAASSRKKVIEEDLNKFRTAARQLAIHAMKHRDYIGLGYLDDRLAFIRPSDWTGTVNWEAMTLKSGDRSYSGVCVLGGSLTPEQEALVELRFAASTAKRETVRSGDVAATAAGRTPGRPSSLGSVMREYRRRQNAKLLGSNLTALARSLADWLAVTHPETPTMSANTVARHISAHFWHDTGLKPPNARK